MPTRAEAVQTLYELINSGILSDELTDELEDIVRCIAAEDKENELGISLWGVEENDWLDLYIAKRSDLIDDAWLKHCQKIYEKYKIK